MSRFVVPSREGVVAGAGEAPDDFAGRIVKYVPTEIVAIFTGIIGGLASAKMDQETALMVGLGSIVAFVIGTVAYIYFRAPVGIVRNAHLIVSPLAFLAWAYPISSSLLRDWFIGWVAIIGQGIVLLLALIIAPGTPKQGG